MAKIFRSIWFWIYTALAFSAGAVFFLNLPSAIESRDELLYGGYSLLYPLVLFIVGHFCCHQFSKAENELFRTFQVMVFTTVSLMLVAWITLFSSASMIWFPYHIVVWGISLWSSNFKTLRIRSKNAYSRCLAVVILFLAPLVTILYVLITGVDDAKLAEQQRTQESIKETVQLNARLINQSLEQEKKGASSREKSYPKFIYILDDLAREKKCSGKRSAELSALLLEAQENTNLIESWFESEDLSAYSHAFLLFVIREFQEIMSAKGEQEEQLSQYSLPPSMLKLQNKLSFELTGVGSNNQFVLNLGNTHVAITEQTIFTEIADLQNSSLRLTKKPPPQTSWSERITALEGKVYLWHIPQKPINLPGFSNQISVFCLGWLSTLMLVILLYSNHRERIARQKLDIASTVAHEFRTPLTGMAVLIENLLEDKSREPKKVTSYLQKMKSSNQRLHQVSEHFFIEGSLKQKNIKLETINWSRWVTEQWQEFISLHKSDTISFVSDINHMEKTALLDQALLSLALQNILRNAFHYTKQGLITIGLTESENYLGIEVKDTGIGMDASTITSVFNKYSRGEDTLTRETEGLGLGLYLAQKISKLHDGKITIESTLNKGSTFTLWIRK